MKLNLKFNKINNYNGLPLINIHCNGVELWNGPVQPEIALEYMNTSDLIKLTITHYGKNTSTDTNVISGQIVNDKNCEIDQIIVDDYNINELKWLSSFTSTDGEIFDKCLFLGKNGTWTINFSLPILKWILSTRHAINNNDPDWEQDYESYIQACRLINTLD